jgi:hypothetical protein
MRQRAVCRGSCVTDRAIGMTAEQTARVFERCCRAEPSGTMLGTGPGMRWHADGRATKR